MTIPNKNEQYPIKSVPSIVFLKNFIKNKNITVGDYTYFSDEHPEDFEKHVTHHYDFIGDQLIIGKFCDIASGVEFIMNGANHIMKGSTTYTFYIFGGDWLQATPKPEDYTYKGNTIIGNDVWIGQNVTILPGVTIGDGAIIGANSTVASDVSSYSIVAGNPARFIRKRFDEKIIAKLEQLAWWDRDINWISKNISQLSLSEPSLEQLDHLIHS